MKPTISLHQITRTELGPIKEYGPTADRGRPFWSRSLLLQDAEGDRFLIDLFSDTETGLQTLQERQEKARQVAYPGYVEGVTEVDTAAQVEEACDEPDPGAYKPGHSSNLPF